MLFDVLISQFNFAIHARAVNSHSTGLCDLSVEVCSQAPNTNGMTRQMTRSWEIEEIPMIATDDAFLHLIKFIPPGKGHTLKFCLGVALLCFGGAGLLQGGMVFEPIVNHSKMLWLWAMTLYVLEGEGVKVGRPDYVLRYSRLDHRIVWVTSWSAHLTRNSSVFNLIACARRGRRLHC
jgi:hypothetical protein